jgi:hypothetical protein
MRLRDGGCYGGAQHTFLVIASPIAPIRMTTATRHLLACWCPRVVFATSLWSFRLHPRSLLHLLRSQAKAVVDPA